MNAAPLVVGLDIGTTKVCTLVGTLTEDHRVDVRGVGIAPSVGLRKGLIVDLDATVEAVRQSQEAAQRMAGQPLTGAHVYVGVTGDHVESFTSHGAIDIHRANFEILQADVDRVTSVAANAAQQEGRIALLEQTRSFTVDGQTGIGNPVHMVGQRLEVALHVVTGERRFLEDVRRCVQRAGLPDTVCSRGRRHGRGRPCPRAELVLVWTSRRTTATWRLPRRSVAHTSPSLGGAHVTLRSVLRWNALRSGRADQEGDAARSATCATPEVKITTHRPSTCSRPTLPLSIVGAAMKSCSNCAADLERSGSRFATRAGVVLSGGASRLSGTWRWRAKCCR